MADYAFFQKGADATHIMQSIKDQGDSVCRGVLNRDVVLQSLQNAQFGYVRFAPIAQIGQKKRGPNTVFVHSFILGRRYYPEDSLFIELICSRPTARDGGVLMALIEEYAIANNYKRMFLDAIGDERLKRWYMRQGYKVARTVHIPTGQIKVWNMVKEIS